MNLKNTISPKNLVKSFFAFSSIYYGVLFFWIVCYPGIYRGYEFCLGLPGLGQKVSKFLSSAA